ncbi:MAG: RsmB/NOP family class I SAM-dependent RNA methyltransferase [Candidatus Roizmanbacteria bacterium]|nr:RsmB/NOP family class I SAM-dependent RNA methyltransferase [Candidatus Roizmanbacteria bacterium]
MQEKLNLPDKFIARIHALYNSENAHAILSSFNEEKSVVLRVNTLKTDVDTLVTQLKNANVTSKQLPWCSYALVISHKSTRELTALPEYAQGLFYIQAASSLLPPILLNPQPTDTILDMTASPGGKTSHLGALMDNTGTIVANDSGNVRIYKLIDTLKRMGVTNTTIEHRDGRALWQTYPEKFDAVLLDAPCSMEARFSNETIDALNWSVKKIKHLARLQKYLLRSALSCTRVGGAVVYSTCTFSPEENEAVINWALTKEEGKVELLPINIPLVSTVNGITNWQNIEYSPTLTHTKRILPSSTTEGFFIAVLKKIGQTVRR